MGVHSYTLPDITTKEGTYTVVFYSDYGNDPPVIDPPLPTPSTQSFIDIGELVEVADDEPSVQKMASLIIKFVDVDPDGTLDAGFFYTAINGGTDNRVYITLDEGSGDTFFFYGIIDPREVVWEELYIGTAKKRMGTIVAPSVLGTIFATPTEDWLDEIVINATANGASGWSAGDPSHLASLRTIFSSLLKVSPIGNGYLVGDTIFKMDSGSEDVFFRNLTGGTAEYTLDEIWLPVKEYTSNYPTTTSAEHPMFDSSDDNYLGKRWGRSYSLAGVILRNFGLVLRVVYNVSTSRFEIHLHQRGRSAADANNVDMAPDGERTIRSVVRSSSDLVLDNVVARVAYPSTNTDYVWISQAHTDETPTPYSTAELPNYVDVNLEVAVLWGPMGYAVLEDIYGGTTTTIDTSVSSSPIVGVRFYNYSAQSYTTYDTTGGSADSFSTMKFLVEYYYWRFTGIYKQITRLYSVMSGEVSGTTSHTNLFPLVRTTIDDGLGSATYFANRVTKYPGMNQVEIEWIAE